MPDDCTGFNKLLLPKKEADWGTIIDPAWWGKGVCSMTLLATIEYAVREWGCKRFTASTSTTNAVMQQTLVRRGWVLQPGEGRPAVGLLWLDYVLDLPASSITTPPVLEAPVVAVGPAVIVPTTAGALFGDSDDSSDEDGGEEGGNSDTTVIATATATGASADATGDALAASFFLSLMQMRASFARGLMDPAAGMKIQTTVVYGTEEGAVAGKIAGSLTSRLETARFGDVRCLALAQALRSARGRTDFVVLLGADAVERLADVSAAVGLVQSGLLFVARTETETPRRHGLHEVATARSTRVLRQCSPAANLSGALPVWVPDARVEADLLAGATIHCYAEEHRQGRFCAEHHKAAVQALNKHGMVVLRGLFDAAYVLEGGEAARADLVKCLVALRRRGVDLNKPGEGPSIENFHELSMREARRCDIRNGAALTAYSAQLRATAVDEGAAVAAGAAVGDGSGGGEGPRNLCGHAGVLGVVSEVMNPHWNCSDAQGNWGRWNFGGGGPDAGPPPVRTGTVGAVMTLPGALPQTLHADTAHTHPHVQLPAHYVNLFLPACGEQEPDEACAGGFKVGQTAFVLGSHILTDAARMLQESPPVGVGAEAASTLVPELERRLVRPQLLPGDALLFDCRLLHFGLSNTSIKTTRPLLYINYYQDYFTDPKNWKDSDHLL